MRALRGEVACPVAQLGMVPNLCLEVVSLREARRAGRAALLTLQTQGGEVCRRACDLKAESFFFFFFFFFKVFICSFGFPGDSDGKESACNAGNQGSIPELGRSPGEGNGNPLQYSCLANSTDGGAWWAPVHGVARSGTLGS